MAVEKQILQAVATLMRLGPLSEGGQLDEVGNGHLIAAEEALLSQSPRVVVDAFVTWNRSGRLSLDPRPVKMTITAELASRDRRSDRPGSRRAGWLSQCKGLNKIS